MQDVGYAALQIIPSFKDLDRNLENGTSRALTTAGTRGGTRFGDAAGRSAGSRFASTFGKVARAGVIGALGATAILGTAAFKLAGNSLEEAREAQKVGALTVAVIKSTGGAAKVTAKEVGDLSEALSNKTGVDDEIIQRGANMMLTFKNVRNEVGKTNDIFDQSVKITADMAAAMAGGAGGDLDLKSSSILVGKALNDPIKGLTALSRVGVTFTEGQKKQIETLIESGERMKAQKIILGELKSEFGGAAEAQATLADKVDVAWGNIQERLGKALLPMVEDMQRAFLKKGVPAIEGWVDAFQKKGIPALKDFYEKAKPVVEKALPEIKDALSSIKDVMGQTLPLVLDLVEAFNDLPEWAKKAVIVGGTAMSLNNKLGGLGGGPLGAVASMAKPLPVFVTNPGGLGVGGVPGAGGKPGAKPIGALPGFAPILPALGAWGNDTFKGEALPMPDDVLMLDPIRKEMVGLQALVAKLPSDLRFNLAVTGGPESKKEVMDLVRTYDLTPKQKRTLFEAYGIDTSKRAIGELKRVVQEHPDKKDVRFNLMGTEEAKSDLRGVKGWMDSIRDKDVFLNVHTRRTNEGGGFGATGSANGGTVPKTGMGYADRHPYLLADGEEVISNRYGQADRYRSLLKAINANRRLADGGTAGHGGGGGGGAVVVQAPSLAGLRIEGRIELTERGGYLRGVIAEEVTADRNFDRGHRRGYSNG